MIRSLGLVVAALLVAPATAVAQDPPGGRIVFERFVGGSYHVMLRDGVTGGAATQLTQGAGTNLSPVWSPDGQKIAYTSFTAGSAYEIWVMDDDGQNARPVTSSAGTPEMASWSPDGASLTYYETLGSPSTARIVTVPANATGAAGTPLTAPGEFVYDRFPSWSPDGTKIAFTRTQGGATSIMTMGAAGDSPTPLSTTPAGSFDAFPTWSPSGDRIAYMRDTPPDQPVQAGEGSVIRVMDANGANDAAIAGTEHVVTRFSWSGDGSWLVFSAMPTSPPLQLFAAPASGGARLPVESSAYQDRNPSWEPDPDTDGDALRDSWETDGIDVDHDGTADLDLEAMGADPNHKDVFVEFDYMAGQSIDRVATDAIVAAFGAAPVGNPDGTSGIHLHIDNGPDSVMNPVTGETWGARSDQEVLPAQETLSGVSGQAFDWAPFDAFKASHFLGTRRKAFHYGIGGVETPASPGGRARSGANSMAGSDFILLIPEESQALTPEALRFQAGTFMHELGHNLGLLHGGGTGLAKKPNYLSVMNYLYQGSWLKRNAAFELDYSRYDFPLDEGVLSELRGYDQTTAVGYITLFACPGGDLHAATIDTAPVDWTCADGISDASVAVDVNADGQTGVLTGHQDWGALRFDGGEVGDGAAGVSMSPGGEEPPASDVLRYAQMMAAATGTHPASAAPQAATPVATPAAAAVLSGLRIRPRTLRPARTGASLVRKLPRRRGAIVRFALTRAAGVTFRIQRRAGGRWVTQKGRFRTAGRSGTNALQFSGRLRNRRLRPGRYRLVATPAGGGAARVSFRIRR